MAAGVAGRSLITASGQRYAAFLVMAVGWATMSGAAINMIIAPWFERRRGLATSLALNGASCGGIVLVPFLIWLIARLGFAEGLYLAVGTMLVVLGPSVLIVLRRHPQELNLWPDGEQPLADEQLEARRHAASHTSPWRRTAALRQVNFWTISLPFALGLAAQVGFLTHQIAYLEPLLGSKGAGFAVSLTTTAAVVGRLITGVFIDRLHRRLVASVKFAMQAIALTALIAFPTHPFLYIACVGFGLGVGNLVSLPALIVHQEFPRSISVRSSA